MVVLHLHVIRDVHVVEPMAEGSVEVVEAEGSVEEPAPMRDNLYLAEGSVDVVEGVAEGSVEEPAPMRDNLYLIEGSVDVVKGETEDVAVDKMEVVLQVTQVTLIQMQNGNGLMDQVSSQLQCHFWMKMNLDAPI